MKEGIFSRLGKVLFKDMARLLRRFQSARLSLRARGARMRCGRIAILLIVLLLSTPFAYAGDEAEHRHLIYALAISAGFSPAEAKIISDGSWSMDTNDPTLAVRTSKIKEEVADYIKLRVTIAMHPDYAQQLLSNNKALDDAFLSANGRLVSRIGPATVMHNLMNDPRARGADPNQPGMNALYRSYIREQVKKLEASLSPDDLKTVRLILVGQHIHQLVDSFVHPKDPLYGHILKGHKTDYAVYNPEGFTQASFAALTAMRTMLTEIRPADDRMKVLKLETPEKQVEFCKNLVNAIKDGYLPRPTIIKAGVEVVRSTPGVRLVESATGVRLDPELVPDPFEVTSGELESIKKNVEKYMNQFFRERGTTYTFEIPHFTKVTYKPQGESFNLYYPGMSAQTVTIDNVVSWMLSKPEYKDLAHSTRESIRRHIRDWQGGDLDNFFRELVGGVMIRFEVYEKAMSTATPAENARMLDALGERLLKAQDAGEQQKVLAGFVTDMKVRFKSTKSLRKLDGLVAISLKSLVARAEAFAGRWESLPEELRHPGGITRIHGYVINPQDEDILILGRRIEGAPPINLDDLIVGVRAVWRDNETPMCSLDPNPEDFGGPQKVRVGGVPGDSQFALTMLDADYIMKKIMFGLESVKAPGFTSFKDILVAKRPGEVSNRFWLYPVQPNAGDIQVSTDGNAVVFMSSVMLLSEEMMRTRDGIIGTGRTFGSAEEAAAIFSRYYAPIEKQIPVYQQLQGLFDTVLLARVWQRMNLQSPLLERLSRLPYRSVAIPQAYAGLTVQAYQTSDGEFRLRGGVEVKMAAGPRTWLVLDDPAMATVRKRIQTATATPGSLAIPLADVSLEVPEPIAGSDAAGLKLVTALNKFRAGDRRGALDELTRLVQADPYNAEPMAIRALVHFQGSDLTAARSDAQKARELDPDNIDVVSLSSIVLFQCDLLEGKAEAALEEIEQAIRLNPTSVRSRILRGDALANLGKISEARKEYEKAKEMDPIYPLSYIRLGLLEMSEGWVVKGSKLIKKAEALVSNVEKGGAQLKSALALAEMGMVVLGNVEEHLAAAEKLAQEALADPACDPQSGLTALIALAGIAMVHDDWNKAEGYLNQARKLAPHNPDLLLAAADFAHDAKRDDLAQQYLNEAERLAPNYPAVKAMRQKIGR